MGGRGGSIMYTGISYALLVLTTALLNVIIHPLSISLFGSYENISLV